MKTNTMIRNFCLVVILLFTVIACNSDAKTAREYSNSIVKIEESLTPDITACENKVTQYFQSQQYDKIAEEGKRMEDLIQTKIDQVKAMPVPKLKQVDKFRSAYIDLFEFTKGFYTGYKKYGMATTDEERQQVLQQIQTDAGKKQDKINEFQRIQREFAEANGAKMEKK